MIGVLVVHLNGELVDLHKLYRFGSASQGFDGFDAIGRFENPRTTDQCMGTSLNKAPCVVGFYPTIDFNEGWQTTRIDHLSNALDLGKDILNQTLATKSGIDRHHQYQIELIQYIFQNMLGGVGIEGYSCFGTQRTNVLHSSGFTSIG